MPPKAKKKENMPPKTESKEKDILASLILAENLSSVEKFEDMRQSIKASGLKIITVILPQRIDKLSRLLWDDALTNIHDRCLEQKFQARPETVKTRQVSRKVVTAHPRRSPKASDDEDDEDDEESERKKLEEEITRKSGNKKDIKPTRQVTTSHPRRSPAQSPGFSQMGKKEDKTEKEVEKEEEEENEAQELTLSTRAFNIFKSLICFLELAIDDVDNLRIFLTDIADSEPEAAGADTKMGEIKQRLNKDLDEMERDLDGMDSEDRDDTEMDRRVLRYLKSSANSLLKNYLYMKLECEAIVESMRKTTLQRLYH